MSRPRILLLGTLLTTLFTPLTVPTLDADPIATGPEQRVNQTITGRQLRADVATFTDGSAVVVWENENGGDRAIVGRLVDATGTPTGGDLSVSTITTEDQVNTRVVTTAAGGFVVVWENDALTDDESSILSRFFDDAGVADPVVEVAAAQMDIDVSLPEIVAAESGRFVVTWDSYDSVADTSVIRGRRLTDSGALDGGAFTLVTPLASNYVFKGSTAPRSADGFVLSWHEDSPGRTLYARRFDAVGGTSGGLETVASGDANDPRIAGLDADALLVVWDTFAAELQRRRHPAGGSASTPVDLDAGTHSEVDAAVIQLPGGGAAIAWIERGGSGQPDRVRVQIVDGADAVSGEVVVDETDLTISRPRLAYDASRAELVVVWTRRGGAGNDQEEIYGRRFALDGIFTDGFEDGTTSAWGAP